MHRVIRERRDSLDGREGSHPGHDGDRDPCIRSRLPIMLLPPVLICCAPAKILRMTITSASWLIATAMVTCAGLGPAVSR